MDHPRCLPIWPPSTRYGPSFITDPLNHWQCIGIVVIISIFIVPAHPKHPFYGVQRRSFHVNVFGSDILDSARHLASQRGSGTVRRNACQPPDDQLFGGHPK
ncbi:hypothetical protein ES288_A07G164400v1 [Gossypium darwinii]|uniref:Uncharacterized protein n=1 Tax=Gossypium darwinii TaxID=34276 RepID=A0A5D2FW89_GOSDA|nr:hypothetical protein ES288_A07G164400v1 [Gossypium darwinii]